MDFSEGTLRPIHVTKSVDLEENVSTDSARTSAGYQKTGDLITLPYTEVVLTEQPFASTIERVAPFKTATWGLFGTVGKQLGLELFDKMMGLQSRHTGPKATCNGTRSSTGKTNDGYGILQGRLQ